MSGFAAGYAFESYVSRGPVWYIVGVTQIGRKEWELEYPDVLDSFNEQIGDLLKEVTEHCTHIDEEEIAAVEEKFAVDSIIKFSSDDLETPKEIIKAAKCVVVSGKYLMRIGTNFNGKFYKNKRYLLFVKIYYYIYIYT